MRRRTILVGAILAGALASATPASAGTISVAGDTVVFVARPGEANVITAGTTVDTESVVIVRDAGASITATGLGCVAVLRRAVCTGPALRAIRVFTGDRNDSVTTYGLRSEIHGGSGNDTLTSGKYADTMYGDSGDDKLVTQGANDVLSGGDGSDELHSGPGDDTLSGGDGDDALIAGDGDDVMVGGGGADEMYGGDNNHINYGSPMPQQDVVSYAGRSAGVNVSLDGIANDGEPGEHDNVATDVEQIDGGDGDDVLEVADGGPQGRRFALNGGDGDDTLTGRDGPDVISGGNGADVIRGGASSSPLIHADVLTGDAGDDLIEGGPGDDYIAGGPGNDREYGGPDSDHFRVDDVGDDYVDGGAGSDDIVDQPGNDELHAGVSPDFAFDNLWYTGAPGSNDWYADGSSSNWDARLAPSAVTVTLDGVANDGIAGGTDNVHPDIHMGIVGTVYDDHLTGNDSPNRLVGFSGNDTLVGLGGRDFLGGDDGDDTIYARDGEPDTVDCSLGNDTAQIDAGLETNVFQCETLLP